jgi:hypothetical protein
MHTSTVQLRALAVDAIDFLWRNPRYAPIAEARRGGWRRALASAMNVDQIALQAAIDEFGAREFAEVIADNPVGQLSPVGRPSVIMGPYTNTCGSCLHGTGTCGSCLHGTGTCGSCVGVA